MILMITYEVDVTGEGWEWDLSCVRGVRKGSNGVCGIHNVFFFSLDFRCSCIHHEM